MRLRKARKHSSFGNLKLLAIATSLCGPGDHIYVLRKKDKLKDATPDQMASGSHVISEPRSSRRSLGVMPTQLDVRHKPSAGIRVAETTKELDGAAVYDLINLEHQAQDGFVCIHQIPGGALQFGIDGRYRNSVFHRTVVIGTDGKSDRWQQSGVSSRVESLVDLPGEEEVYEFGCEGFYDTPAV